MRKIEIAKSRAENLETGDVIRARVFHGATDGDEWLEVVVTYSSVVQLKSLAADNHRAYSAKRAESIGAALAAEKAAAKWIDGVTMVVQVQATGRDSDGENYIFCRKLELFDTQVPIYS